MRRTITKTTRAGEMAQINIRARSQQIAYWEEAARIEGYSSLAAWIKVALGVRATEAFSRADQHHAGDDRPTTITPESVAEAGKILHDS